MDRTVMWMQWNNLGMEQLHIENNRLGTNVDGVVVGIRDGRAFRARYQIDTTADWQVRHFRIELLQSDGAMLSLRSNRAGQWWRSDDTALPDLNGCLDMDLAATPFTNTLAIRRLALQPGEMRQLTVVHITVPELTIRALPQRYTCLEVGSQGSVYRYEALSRNFSADLLVDRDGLVIEYPQAFRRIWSVAEPR
jgi:uncharacterized protein